MNDLRLEAMDAPLVRLYHDQVELCLKKVEAAWSPVSRWLWDRKLKEANTLWRQVLEQEIAQLRTQQGMTPSTRTSPQPTLRLELDTAALRMILD